LRRHLEQQQQQQGHQHDGQQTGEEQSQDDRGTTAAAAAVAAEDIQCLPAARLPGSVPVLYGELGLGWGGGGGSGRTDVYPCLQPRLQWMLCVTLRKLRCLRAVWLPSSVPVLYDE
jgi:hypothetical protein